jgi:ribose-phosphate pyrophosphokinase
MSMSSCQGPLKIFSGNAHPGLAGEICRYLGLELGGLRLTTFSDGESYCQILDNVRGGDVFVIQPTCTPANQNIMELLLMLDAFKRSSADRVTAVIPYYGYARQDRKDKPRVPISSKLVADLLSRAGADRVLTMDLHAPTIQGFFDIPVDHLYAAPVLIDYMAAQNLENLVIVSPDAGGVERARAYAKRLGGDLAIIDKRRSGPNVAEVMHLIGDVRGKTAVIVDDIVDTAGTLTGGVKTLRENGAARVLACFTHGVLSGPAAKRLKDSEIEQIVVTDTIPLSEEMRRSGKVLSLSVAPLLGEAIRRIHDNASVSSLFV